MAKQKPNYVESHEKPDSLCGTCLCIYLCYSVVLLTISMSFYSPPPEVNKTFTIDHEANTFLMDGKPFRFISGSIHYFRAVPEAWHKRLQSMKAAGLNVIDIYVEWSLHNPHDGVYKSTGIANLEKFLKLAKAQGFYVILRPGPYIGAERDNGGLPYWLFGKYPGIKVRTSDANYTHEISLWYSHLLSRMTPLLYGNGGPIIMVQVENEYGSFSACDHVYMEWLRDEILKYVSDNAVLFTSDFPSESLECGRVKDVFATINFGINETQDLASTWNKLRAVQPTGPLVNSAFYVGGLTHWHEPNQRLKAEAVATAVDAILASNASVNLYMFSGGTNFGFTAGANELVDGTYAPDITSYDYDALLNEWGNPTEKYKLIRDVIRRYFRIPDIKTIKENTYAYGNVTLKPVLNLLSSEGFAKLGHREEGYSSKTKSFEELSQYSGLVLYETNTQQLNIKDSLLNVNDLRDRAYVYIDHELQGILSRQDNNFSLILERNSSSTLQILVENQGRISYNIANDTKGIMGPVTLQNSNGEITEIKEWLHTRFPLENLNIKQLLPSNGQFLPETRKFLTKGPTLYYGKFSAKKLHHTFLNTKGWGKGVAYVNGFNLGRYWPLAGPQVTLYVPQEILRKKHNTLVLIEYEQTNRASHNIDPYVTLDSKPQLDNFR